MSTISTPLPGLIDRYLPEFTFGHRYDITVDSDDIGEVYAIARDLDLSRSPVVPLLFKLRGLPVKRLNARAFTAAMGWADIEETAPSEFLIGYRRRGRMEPVVGPHRSAADPADVTQKVVFSFRFSRRPDGRVLVDTETRVLCIGPGASRRYLPYWLAIKPFSGLIRREILRLIKQEAEQRMQQRRQQAARQATGAAAAASWQAQQQAPQQQPHQQQPQQQQQAQQGRHVQPTPVPVPQAQVQAPQAQPAGSQPAGLPRPRTVVQLPRAVVLPLRGFFKLASVVWPSAAIGTFQWLLGRMPKRPLRPAEQAFLGGAERLDFRCPDGTVLAGYAFGRGPTVLMVHGLLGSSANYHVMINALVERGYRVVAVDGLNHGNSPAGSIVSDAPVRQIADVMRQLGDLHAVVGHSAGAYVVMMALLDFPAGATLKKCVYLAPYPDLESSLVSFMDYFAVPERLAPALRAWFSRIGGRPLEQQSFQACLTLHRTPLPPARLFVHDVDDQHAPVHRTQQMLANDPASELFLTQGLGHFRVLRDPTVIARVAAFLDEGRAPT
jgi:pimeloyl-ACP methyl ester carboxylesterase